MIHVVRGLPGSGKTTFAKSLGVYHVEADMFFVRGGEYRFDISKIRDAHEWCQAAAREALSIGIDVVVSNTFTTMWEIKPYLEMDIFKIYCCCGTWGSIHNVPPEALQRMAERWEPCEGEVFLHSSGSLRPPL